MASPPPPGGEDACLNLREEEGSNVAERSGPDVPSCPLSLLFLLALLQGCQLLLFHGIRSVPPPATLSLEGFRPGGLGQAGEAHFPAQAAPEDRICNLLLLSLWIALGRQKKPKGRLPVPWSSVPQPSRPGLSAHLLLESHANILLVNQKDRNISVLKSLSLSKGCLGEQNAFPGCLFRRRAVKGWDRESQVLPLLALSFSPWTEQQNNRVTE